MLVSRRIFLVLLLLIAMSFALHAGEFDVTTTDDAGGGSLREAVESVNNTADPANTIRFRTSGTIRLEAPLEDILYPVVFEPDGNSVTVEAHRDDYEGSVLKTGAGDPLLSFPEHLVLSVTGPNSVAGLMSDNDIAITGDLAGTARAEGDGYAAALYPADGGLVIGGDLSGTLSVTSGRVSWGVRSLQDITIEGDLSGTITADSRANAYGLHSFDGDIMIGGDLSGEVQAISDNSFSFGLHAGSGSVLIKGDLTGTVRAQADGVDVRGLDAGGGALTIEGDLTGTVSASSNGFQVFGLHADDDLSIDGNLSGSVGAVSSEDGMVAGLISHGGSIYGRSPETSLVVSGLVRAEGQGAASGIISDDGMNLLVTGTVSGIDYSGNGLGYAIRSGKFFRFGGYYDDTGEVTDIVTIAGNGALVGNVLLGNGQDIMTLSDNADIDGVPELSGGGGQDLLLLDRWNGTFDEAEVVHWEEIIVTGGSVADLGKSRTLGGFSDGAFMMKIEHGSVLSAVGNSPGLYRVEGYLENSGMLDMRDGDADDELRVTGDYTGGGRIGMDVVFDEGDADLLIVDGKVSGVTAIDIQFQGAALPGSSIELVRVAGQSLPQDFVAGAFNGPYVLDLTEEDGVWSVINSGSVRDEAAVTQGVMPFVDRFSRMLVPRFHERRAYGWGLDKAGASGPWWMQTDGSSFSLGLEGDAAATLDGHAVLLRVGYDLLRDNVGEKHVSAGLFAGTGYQHADVLVHGDETVAGGLEQTSWYGGLYACTDAPGKYFVETVLQAVYHDVESEYQSEERFGSSLWHCLVSFETGFSVPLNPDIRVEPHVHFLYRSIGGFDLQAPFDQVTVEDHDGLTGLLGIGFFLDNKYGSISPFLEIDLIKDFGGKAGAAYVSTGTDLATGAEDLMIESTIGIRGRLSADGASGYYLKAGLSYGLDGAGSREYMLSTGVRAEL